MHLTRVASSKFLPIPRKGTKYLVVPSHNSQTGIPLVIVMRDVLKLVKSKKELKKILLEKKIKVNEREVKEVNQTLLLFDTIKIDCMDLSYRVTYSENKKITLEKIDKKESNFKIVKVTNKKILKNNKQQINFNDGRNILSNEKVNTGDSIRINLTENKIEKILSIKEKSKSMVIKGKHIGKTGEISKIEGQEITIKTKDGEIKTNEKEIIVLN